MRDAPVEPATIGPFVVRRRLGEGAMGVVYAAHDDVLDRPVAIKLVRRHLLGDPAIRARMLREAQAMARLASPHVVQVFQVGEYADSLYLAMEYVEGQTLTAWLAERERPWSVVLRTLCDAGRGLDAAHAAGLVHRDFKPDNVLVDALGRARVADFGLVRTERDGLDPEEEAAVVSTVDDGSTVTTQRPRPRWTEQLTQHGRMLGTPAYMAPEQHFGQPVGPAADQFSFAVALYEALYGARPFSGATLEEIRGQLLVGVVPPPPPRSPVPRRLFRVIARGLARRPEERWPSMGAMIAALEHDPWRLRSRVAVAAALVCTTAVVSYAVANVQAESRRCQGSDRGLVGVWDPEREAAVARAFQATEAEFAAGTLTRVRARLDAYAKAWVREHQAACDAHASGAETGSMMDLRVACLGRRKLHLDALVEQFTAADRSVVEKAVQAVAALPSVEACADVDQLVGAPAPPNDPGTATRVTLLHEQLARAAVLEATGRYAAGIELVEQVRGQTAAVGYVPVAAEAALTAGRLYLAAARWTEAEAALTEAARLGIAHDLHAIAAEAVARRIFVVGEGLGRRIEALAIEPFAEAMVQRSRDDGGLSALLHNNLGAVYDTHGDTATASSHYERTIVGLERRPGTPDPLIAITHNNLGNMNIDRGDFDAAREHFGAARELFTSLLGDAHPFVAHAIAGLGDADARRGADADALASYFQALERMEAAYGRDHLYLLHPLTGLGEVFARLGQTDQAEGYFSRAVAIAARLDAGHPLYARALAGLADIAAASGELARAGTLYAQAARVYRETEGADSAEGARAALRAEELAARAAL
jgi:tetratricopeptide (TPR) repeat protein/tRNA A-37 threonylcarbamoyl transferase component Bud32